MGPGGGARPLAGDVAAEAPESLPFSWMFFTQSAKPVGLKRSVRSCRLVLTPAAPRAAWG